MAKPYIVHHGELLTVLPSLAGKFHAVLCDPPYGLEFMGKEWDAPHKATSFPKAGNIGGFADGNKPSIARQGQIGPKYQSWVTSWALLLCFGGTRTWHRLAAGLEDAGFQMWDTLMWLHGQGFPKAQDISKLIDKSNGHERRVLSEGKPVKRMIPGADQDKTGSWIKDNGRVFVPTVEAAGSDVSAPWSGHKTCALKPAWEPVLCFRAPSGGKSYAELATEFGSGCLNVDGGRIAVTEKDARDVGRVITRNVRPEDGWGFNGDESDRTEVVKANGRYPANVALECVCEQTEVVTVRPSGGLTGGEPSASTDEIYGNYGPRQPFTAYPGVAVKHTNPDCPCFILDTQSGDNASGGASRFFYTAKADSSERHSLNEVTPSTRNHHPTVKPIDLCRWLATLLLPPESVKPRRLLVPFSGSGSEMIGALQAGWDEVIGIDQDSEYCKLVPARIEHHVGLFAQEA